MTEQDNAFLDWLDSGAGQELCSTRKGLTLIHELAIEAAVAIKKEEAEREETVSD